MRISNLTSALTLPAQPIDATQTLGLIVPQALLVSANEVID